MSKYYLDDYDNSEYEPGEYNSNPGLGAELILAENPNPMGATAMTIASDLRHEGWDASSALSEGWRQAKGETNPDIEISSSPLTLTLVGIGVGLLIFRAIKKSWPWQIAGIAKAKQIARPIRPLPQATAERQRFNVSPVPSGSMEEKVSLITP